MATMTRRDFSAALAASSAAVWAAGTPPALAAPGFKTTLHKALISGIPSEKTITAMKEVGFEGIECNAWKADMAKAEAGRKTAERLGFKIHSVLRGWTQFNDAKAAPGHIATVETALRTSAALGADALLLVPCRVGGMPMPAPHEFEIEFDKKTGHVTRVAAGDNEQFAAYIKAQNQATDMSRLAHEKLIPVAEREGVVIAVENVWNNLWVKPDLFTHFVGSFKSKWVQAYFDIGNHVKYAPPEEWIRALGKLIAKCHIKDFKLNPDGKGGKFVNIRDGSVNWPLVRRELDRIGYNGWMTIEGSGKLSNEEKGKRLDMIIAGK